MVNKGVTEGCLNETQMGKKDKKKKGHEKHSTTKNCRGNVDRDNEKGDKEKMNELRQDVCAERRNGKEIIRKGKSVK